MSKRACWATTLVFLLFIALFFSLNLILPDKSFSEQENRAAADAAGIFFPGAVFRGLYRRF